MSSRKKSGVRRARELRRGETDAERKLWMRLRDRQLGGAKFRRQQPLGPFVADFCSLKHKLIVEVDGGQHASNVESDAARTAFLERYGYKVLRFWDDQVLQNTEAVLEQIAATVTTLTPTLFQREREQ